MDESKLLIQTHTLSGGSSVTEYIYPCSGCKSRITRHSMADLLAVFTSVSDGQFMRSCQRCRAKGIQNRKRRRDESTTARADEDDDDDDASLAMDLEARCGTFEEFEQALARFMAEHDNHPEFDQDSQPTHFRFTILAGVILPRSATCPARTVDAIVRDTAESQKIAALMIRDAVFDATGYFFQLRKGGRPHPDGGKYNFSCSRAEERKGAYDRTKRMREGGVRQRRTKARQFFRCEGRVMMCFSKTNSWVTVAYGHKRHGETPKIHDKKEKAKETPSQPLPMHTLVHSLDPAAQTQIDPALMDPVAAMRGHFPHPAHSGVGVGVGVGVHGFGVGHGVQNVQNVQNVVYQDQYPDHGGISLHTVG
ncbi:hypothetical protein V1512DRAFT_256568 [Lipomyces arxii]|uniref:uncharacterized protein n=1 Tax=Lipomyces arxii TaxID=56418 RepID=UPI0034CF20F2